MQAQSNVVQYVEWPEFIVVILAVVSLIIAITSIAFNKISSVSERIAVTEKQNEGDEQNFKVLFSKIDYLEKERVNDKIIYNEAINKLNITLSKIEIALENNNSVVKELKDQLNRRNDR